MRKDNNHETKLISVARNHRTGTLSAILSFLVVWPLDTSTTRMRFYGKPVFSGGFKQSWWNYLDAISPNHKFLGWQPLAKSFINVGFGWGLAYHLSAGTLALPMQTELQQVYLEQFDTGGRYTVSLRALAGWHAAFIQLMLLHPLDSMKVKAQKSPEVFNGSVIRYFLTHQPELRRGMGVVGMGSITHFLAWHVKLYTQFLLQQAGCNQTLQTPLSAMAFSMTHILLAFPVNTIKTWAQGDADFSPRNKTFMEKASRTQHIVSENITREGLRSFYRGFGTRGGMHMFSFALTMSAYDKMQASANDTNLAPGSR